MANILVMMSTYNGSEFLKIQLDSLLNQIGVETKIIIRDDGSEDGTQEILEEKGFTIDEEGFGQFGTAGKNVAVWVTEEAYEKIRVEV